MARRSKWDWEEEEDAAEAPVLICWLCGRPLGEATEWHHPVPKSRGGKLREPVHPICHEAIHAHLTNSQLAKTYSTPEALRGHDEIGRFVEWVSSKPPDFYAVTKKPN